MTTNNVIEAVSSTGALRRAYNLHSNYYRWVVAPLERKARDTALERAKIGPDERVLEVAVGPGLTFVDILRRVSPGNTVDGVDLSPRMLDKTRRLAQAKRYSNFRLQEADARKLPFADSTFDVLVNNYMLDLVPLAELSQVVGEFKRVLKPGGRLVLVNMSKENGSASTWWERLYRTLPTVAVTYLLGGCRPVLVEPMLVQAGFVQVEREYLARPFPSEIVTGVVGGRRDAENNP